MNRVTGMGKAPRIVKDRFPALRAANIQTENSYASILLLRRIFRHFVGQILLVGAGHVFVKANLGALHIPSVGPRLGEHLRIVVCDLYREVIKIGAPRF